MKKLVLLLIGVSTLLTACSFTKNYSDQELKTQYEESLQETIATFKELFSENTQNTQTMTDLSLTLLPIDGLQGNATYSSSSIRREKNDHTVHTIFLDLLNSKNKLPILFSGNIVTSYQNQLLYLMIKEFDLFTEKEDIEINFINLLAKQLKNKRILMDDPESSPIGVVNIPTISEITDWIQKGYSSSTSAEEQSIGLQKLFTFVSDLFNLSLSTENLQINNEVSGEETRNFNKQISYNKVSHYISEKQSFTNIFSYTPKQIIF